MRAAASRESRGNAGDSSISLHSDALHSLRNPSVEGVCRTTGAFAYVSSQISPEKGALFRSYVKPLTRVV